MATLIPPPPDLLFRHVLLYLLYFGTFAIFRGFAIFRHICRAPPSGVARQRHAHIFQSLHFGVTAGARRYRSLKSSDEGGLRGGLACLTSGMVVSLMAP